MTSASDHVAQGLRLHQQGELPAAEKLYRKVLEADPNQLDALHLLGVLCVQKGDPQAGVEMIRKVVSCTPDHPTPMTNLGNAYMALGQHSAALQCHDEALRLAPQYVDALFNRGNVLQALGRYDEAIGCFDQVLALAPQSAEAHMNRGVALLSCNRFDSALGSFDRAVAIRADLALGHHGRATALLNLHRYADALAACEVAVRLGPRDPNAHILQGNVFLASGQANAACDSYRRAIEISPADADAYFNLANALLAGKRTPDALAEYDQACNLRPTDHRFWYNRGNALRDLQCFTDAAKSFSRARELEPDCPYALGSEAKARQQACSWIGLGALEEQVLTGVRSGRLVATPFDLLGISGSASDLLACAQINAREYPVTSYPNRLTRHARIRVAYLSSDFRCHATAYLIAGLIESHDLTRFETYAYSFGPEDGTPMQQRMRRAFEHFIDVRGSSDQEIVAMMRAREIDIAVDLNGFTTGRRTSVFMLRCAPIQVNFLAYPGTMGSPAFDYVIGDDIVIPKEHERYFSEQVVRMPGCYQVNDYKRVAVSATSSRREAGLPQRGFVYCCFNNAYKYNPLIFDTWMRLLEQTPDAVLWLLDDNQEATANLKLEAQRRGVPHERLVFAPRVPVEQHLARHRLADLALDTLPYNAHTTASDALWMGVPVVTCVGNSFAGRVAASLLKTAGIPEMITTSLADYEAKALEYVRSPATAQATRRRLEAARESCRLFDTERYAREFESALIAMYERWQGGLAPFTFSVVATANDRCKTCVPAEGIQ